MKTEDNNKIQATLARLRPLALNHRVLYVVLIKQKNKTQTVSSVFFWFRAQKKERNKRVCGFNGLLFFYC